MNGKSTDDILCELIKWPRNNSLTLYPIIIVALSIFNRQVTIKAKSLLNFKLEPTLPRSGKSLTKLKINVMQHLHVVNVKLHYVKWCYNAKEVQLYLI